MGGQNSMGQNFDSGLTTLMSLKDDNWYYIDKSGTLELNWIEIFRL
jgi:hypothetical protein